MKTKVDITQLNKLSRAFLIMLTQANLVIDPYFKNKHPSIAVEFLPRQYSRYNSNTKNLHILGASKRGYKDITNEVHIPERCQQLYTNIRTLYPRMSDISVLDRKTTIGTASVNAESIDWAEFAARQEGVDVSRGKYMTFTEVTKVCKTRIVKPGEPVPKVSIGAGRVKKDTTKVTIEDMKVVDL